MKKTPMELPHVLGIEGGATRTVAVCMNAAGQILKRIETGPCNLRLLKDHQILLLWRDLRSKMGCRKISAVGAFLAGCRTCQDEKRVLKLLHLVWPTARHSVGNDSLSTFAAALGDRDGVVLVCGTGSIVRARHGARWVNIGGWGHIGGDRGSGYWMGHAVLRSIFQSYDETGSTHQLAQSVLHFLGFNTIEELIPWSLKASKTEIASLAHVLFQNSRLPIFRKILGEAAELLARDVALACRKVGLHTPQVALNHGLAKHQPLFRKLLSQTIRKHLPNAHVFLSEKEGAVGAALIAAGLHEARLLKSAPQREPSQERRLLSALTEQRNPRTLYLDRYSISRLIEIMLTEEARVIPAIRSQKHSIARGIAWITAALKRRGRLFYIGAGTSGRIGVLDASECPPTFGRAPDMVQGIIAGGRDALRQSMESAEDDADDGRRTVLARGIKKSDVVVGITASGSTPFVIGALKEAHRRGSKVIFLTFNPAAAFHIHSASFLRIPIPTGPEILTGSTRLKAGTATKLVLNMFSTISLIRLGHTKSNLMVNLDPSCEKLHTRAAQILSALRHIPYEAAWLLLEKSRWNLQALLKKRPGLGVS